MLVTNCFSTQASYENQTKKAVTNKFIQEAMNDVLPGATAGLFPGKQAPRPRRLPTRCWSISAARESAEKAKISVKKKLSGSIDIANRVQKFVDCRSRDTDKRELYIVEGDSALGSVKLSRDAEFQGIMPVRGKILNCLKADYGKIFKSRDHHGLDEGPGLRRGGRGQENEGAGVL